MFIEVQESSLSKDTFYIHFWILTIVGGALSGNDCECTHYKLNLSPQSHINI